MTTRRWVVLALLCGCAPARLAHVVYTPPDDASSFGAAFEALHGADVAACLDAARAVDPERIGRVVVNFAIKRDGEVTLATVARNTTGDVTLATCLLDVATTARFPADSATRAVSLPFLLRPDGDAGIPPVEVIVGPAEVNAYAPSVEDTEIEIAGDVLACLELQYTPAPWRSVPKLLRQTIQPNGYVGYAVLESPFPLSDSLIGACLLERIKTRRFPPTGLVGTREVPLTFTAAEAASPGLDCGLSPGTPAAPESPDEWFNCAAEWPGEPLSDGVELCRSGCWPACVRLATSYVEAGFLEESEEPACLACRASPGDCALLGTVMRETSRVLEAEMALDAACGRSQLSIDDCVAYADLLVDRGQCDEASAAFRRHIRPPSDARPRGPADSHWHPSDDFSTPQSTWSTHAARYALMGGRPEEAEQIVRDCDFFGECRVTLAAALLAQGRTDEALATYREELGGQPWLASAVEDSLDLVASAYPEQMAMVEAVRRALAAEAAEVEENDSGTAEAPADDDDAPPATAEEP